MNPNYTHITDIWDAWNDLMKEKKAKEMASKKNAYQEYTDETQQFMASVEKYLKQKYGKIEPQWNGQLTMLATNYDLFILAKAQVNKDGMMIPNRFGTLEKHPLLKQITDTNHQIIKMVQEFGLSPNAKGKIKQPKDGKDEEKDLIAELLND